MDMPKKLVALAGASLIASTAQAAPITETEIVSDWSAENSLVYDRNDARWGVSGDTISNGGNRVGSLVSDFDTSGDFSFSTSIRANGDNDYMGIVFGWQDSDNSYALGWGGGGVGGSWGLNGINLFNETGGVRTSLASDALTWTSGVIYDFTVGRSGNDIFASIVQGTTTLFSATIEDTTFMTGNVGFDTFSQNSTFSFGRTDYTDTSISVSEPATLALLGLGLAGLGLSRRKAS